MPKVRMLTSMGGFGFNFQPGQIIELPEAEARRWIEHGVAVPAKADADTDHVYSTATAPRGESRHVRGGGTASSGPSGGPPRPSKQSDKAKPGAGDDAGK